MILKHIHVVFIVFTLNKVCPQSTTSRQVQNFIITAPQLDSIKPFGYIYLEPIKILKKHPINRYA